MKLIRENGQPHWGRFDEPPSVINWADYDVRNALGQPRSAWLKPRLFKHFDFYGATGPDFTFGCGMVRLGWVNSTFAYLHHAQWGLKRVQFDLPGDWGLKADYAPHGTSAWAHPLKPGYRVLSHRTAGERALSFEFGPEFSGHIRLENQDLPVLSMNTPIANTGFAYAQKTTGCAVSGTVQLNGRPLELDPAHHGCYHDWTAGFLRRETFWNWACATGRTSDQAPLVAVNVARGVNETSAHENVIWVDGQRFDLPLVMFDYDRDNVSRPWRVYSACGAVDMAFVPEGSIDDHRNLWLIASRFNQCFGRFEGKVRVPGTGLIVDVTGLTGWCEDHYAKW